MGADNPPIITGRRITKGERGGGTRRPGADSPSHQTALKLPINHGNAMFLKPAPAGAMRSKNVNPLLCKKAERVIHVFADLIAAPRASTAYRTPRTRHRVLPGRRGCRGAADTPPCAGSTRGQVVTATPNVGLADCRHQRGRGAPLWTPPKADDGVWSVGSTGDFGCDWRISPISPISPISQEPLGAARDAVWSSKSPFVRQAEALGVGFGRR